MAKLKREHSSGGIVIKEDASDVRVLLIKDGYGKWTWPKGKFKKGEGPLDAAKREIGEETGLRNIELISEIGRTNYFYKRDDNLIYKTVLLYLFKNQGDEALEIQKSEIKDGRWYTKKEALRRLDYHGASGILKRAFDILKNDRRKISEAT